MYVVGGETDDGTTASILKFYSAEGSWSEVAPMPVPREAFASCVYKSDIYVFGGYDERGEDHDAQVSVLKFDTEANEWSTQAPLPVESAWHSASVLCFDGQIYILGAGDFGREVLRFDPMTNAWSTLAQTLYARKCGMSFVLAGCLYAMGGSPSASMERHDVATNTWTPVAAMLEGRGYFCAVCIESEGPPEGQNLFDSLIAKALTQ
jgi:N-acetylneuraminic acid mutarotase